MVRHPNPLIERMAADLQPVRPLRFRDGLILVSLAGLVTVLVVELLAGLWRGALTGEASAFFVLTNGLLLVLGCASASSVLKMGNPRVGGSHDGPKWAMGMVAVLPVAALVTVIGDDSTHSLIDDFRIACFAAALSASVLTAATLIFWLRRGAPVSPAMAGLHLGVASTALGSVAYGMACSFDEMIHLSVWHLMPVIAGGLIGRFVVPFVLRW